MSLAALAQGAALPREAARTLPPKAYCSDAGREVGNHAIQCHGGIGFTYELGLHFWFKRIGANRQLLGSPDRIREEAAKLQQLV